MSHYVLYMMLWLLSIQEYQAHTWFELKMDFYTTKQSAELESHVASRRRHLQDLGDSTNDKAFCFPVTNVMNYRSSNLGSHLLNDQTSRVSGCYAMHIALAASQIQQTRHARVIVHVWSRFCLVYLISVIFDSN